MRIGVTMRIVAAETYEEPRDALAHDWGRFLTALAGQVMWMPIPNLGAQAVEFADAWDLDGLILAGGDDVGAHPLRDETERALLDHFRLSARPVFGVCRGMQLINIHLGGSQKPCRPDIHVGGAAHNVRFVDELASGVPDQHTAAVNSYHRNGIGIGELAEGLTTFAVTDDDLVEGFYSRSVPLAAVMWHPERQTRPDQTDLSLMRHVFGLSQVAVA